MTSYIALLRGINVGGHRKVAMSDLRELLSELGYTQPQSLLQSGNLVFRGAAAATARIEAKLEAEAVARLGLATDIFVRTAVEWNDVIGHNPFREEAAHDPGHLLVFCLKDPPATANVRALQAAIKGRESARVHGRHAYIVFPDGVGRSTLTHARIERTLGTRGTGRNWNTVLKLGVCSA